MLRDLGQLKLLHFLLLLLPDNALIFATSNLLDFESNKKYFIQHLKFYYDKIFRSHT